MILDELFKSFRLSPNGMARRLLEPLVRRPAHNLAELVGGIEEAAMENRLATGLWGGLGQFAHIVRVSGQEHLPNRGPLLIVSNHPGAFDILVVLSQIARNDIKLIIGDRPIMHGFSGLNPYLIFTNFQPNSGMQAAREALRHLKRGGALLLYASAGIDPDPALDLQGALKELNNWKPSLDIFLRQVPETQVVVTIMRGIVDGGWVRHPLTRIGKRPIDKRRIGEMLQIIDQLVFPGRLMMEPRIQFAPPVTAMEIKGDTRLTLIHKGEEMLLESWKSF